MNLPRRLGLGLLMAVAACGGDGTGPDDNSVTVAVQSGDQQFGAPSEQLLDPLQVVVTDPVSDEPVQGVSITWQVVTGGAAVVTPAQSNTDENGVATASLRLGSALGTYVVEASASRMVGGAARFTAQAVNAPAITSAPTTTDVGDTITIAGTNFSPQPDDNLVLFGGFRGRVVTATATQLRVVVPACLPVRTVPLTVSLGAVASGPVSIAVLGSTVSPLQLNVGAVRTFSDPAELSCFQVQGGIAGYTVLLVPQNVSDVASTMTTLQLAGLSSTGPVATVTNARVSDGTTSWPSTFERKLREREQKLLATTGDVRFRPQPQAAAVAACPSPPQVGNNCSFQVINKDDDFVTVTAQLKAISTRALIYQDVEAPANGLSNADFAALGASFDDPIYAAVSDAFGAPSDIDANSRVIVLLTPVVNAMTARGASGFIAGFFYGCDLVSRSACTGTNSAEIFYTMTADPTGQFSDARSVLNVLRALPPVLGHELQHMINFGQRFSTDALWLSEGLAHHAEDVVADVYAARGDATNANLFRQQNYLRAIRYLRNPTGTSLIADGGTGTLELRGAGWLFVKYLVGQFGQQILAALTESSSSSVTNVVQQTGRSWSSLFGTWSVALYVDNAPELNGATVDPVYTFPNINLRTALIDAGSYALRPATETFTDFIYRVTLPASSATYLHVQAGSGNPSAMSFNLAGPFGGAFAGGAVPQLSIVRLQ